MDFPRLHEILDAERPRYIVNCIGMIKQREASKAAIPSITLNSLLPHKLAEWAGEWGGRVIHFSTDCVFSGRDGGYTEASPSDAEDLYGKSKYLGEVAARTRSRCAPPSLGGNWRTSAPCWNGSCRRREKAFAGSSGSSTPE